MEEYGMFINTAIEGMDVSSEIHPPDHRVYQGKAATCVDRCADLAHKYGISFLDYLRIAEIAASLGGKKANVDYEGRVYRVQFKGTAMKDGKEYLIVRAVVPVVKR